MENLIDSVCVGLPFLHSMIHTWDSIKSSAVVWGPFVSGLVAAFIVHLLTQSREREKWILDCKKQEYRELMEALSDMFVGYEETVNVFDGEKNKRLAEAVKRFTCVVRTRLYIAKDISLEQIQREWMAAVTQWREVDNYQSEAEFKNLFVLYERIRHRIIEAANRSVPKTAMQRLAFWKKDWR